MNSTVNEPGCSSQLNSTAEKVGQTFAYCIILVLSLVGNSSIGIIVYRTQTMRKPTNYFVTNMAMSDLLYSIFFFPHKIALLYKGQSWLVGSGFGLAMCKLLPFLSDTSTIVSVQSLILIAVDRFGAVLFPLRCLHSSRQHYVPSSFSPHGLLPWLITHHIYLSTNW